MKNRFFGTFLSGAEEIVEGMLRQRLKDVEISCRMDGAVEFETAVPYSDLNLFCFNNLFRVLHQSRTNQGAQALEDYLRELPFAQADWDAVREHPAQAKTFRLVTSQRNRLVSVGRGPRDRLEKKIAGLSGLRVDRSRPDMEFWLLARSEGTCWFLKRLSRHTAYDKLLAPGELHPELAYMLCWLTQPRHTDTALDPFCGSGSIPLQRCRRFPYTRIYAFDRDEKAVKRTRERLSGKSGTIVVENRDALSLGRTLGAETVDAIITDPPWGLYRDVGMDLAEFYRRMLEQFCVVLRPGGRVTLLTAGKEELAAAAEAFPALRLEKRFDILVSGKKSAIFVFSFSGGQPPHE